jgi:hypothetical protein
VQTKAELILEKWIADLANRDRSKLAVSGNFEELVDKWQRAKVPFSEAKELMTKAINAHLPSDYRVKETYKKLKRLGNTATLSEFKQSWSENITKTGTSVFYSFYDIPGTDANSENKMYGNMTGMEYRKQQKYADSHPTLDWENVRHEPIEVDADEMFDDIDLDVDLGDL